MAKPAPRRVVLPVLLLLALPATGPLSAPEARADGAEALPAPAPLAGAAVADGYNGIYLFGGAACASCSAGADILRHDPATGNYALVGSLPSGRVGAMAATWYPHVYVFGGANGSTYLDEVVRFDVETHQVSVMNATLPTGRAWGGAVAEWPGIRILGGRDAGGPLAQTLLYAVENDTLSVGNLSLPEGLSHFATASGNGVQLFGGLNATGPTDRVVTFRPGNGTFTHANATLPTPTWGASAAADYDNAFVFGGANATGPLATILRYAVEQDRFILMDAALPSARNATAAIGYIGEFFVYGGIDGDGAALQETVRYHVVPGAPTDMAASASGAEVALSWSPPAESTYSRLWGHHLYRAPAGGTASIVAYLQEGVFSALDAPGNGSWTYFVRAHDVYGREGADGPHVTVQVGTPPPSAPRNLSATGGSTRIDLAWSAPAEGPVDGYRIERRNATSPFATLADVSASQTSYTDAGLPPHATFTYRVSARNGGGEGPASSEANATTLDERPPSAPLGVSALGGLAHVDVSWNASADPGGAPILGYRVYGGNASTSDALLADTGLATTYNDTPLAPGATRHYRVRAYNAFGEGDASPTVSASAWSAPGAPRNLTAAGGVRVVNLSWSPPASDGGVSVLAYLIYRNGTPIAEVAASVHAYQDAGLANGTAYTYEVSARNAAGEGPRSAPAAGTTAAAPSAPRNLSALKTLGGIQLTWAAPASDGGAAVTNYLVYRSSSSSSLGTKVATLGDVLTWTDTGCRTGKVCHYRVAAVNAVGEGARSTQAFAVG